MRTVKFDQDGEGPCRRDAILSEMAAATDGFTGADLQVCLGLIGDDSNCDGAFVYCPCKTTIMFTFNLTFQAVVYTAQLNAVKEVIAAGPESNPGN